MIKEITFVRYQSNGLMYMHTLNEYMPFSKILSRDINMLAEWRCLYEPYRTNLFKFKLYKRGVQ